MVKITPDPPDFCSTSQPSDTQLLDRAAMQRALDYYLLGAKPQPSEKGKPFIASEGVSLEEALVHASGFLRCAAATAYESGESLGGAQRDLVFSVMHLVEMAKVMMDRSLDCIQTC